MIFNRHTIFQACNTITNIYLKELTNRVILQVNWCSVMLLTESYESNVGSHLLPTIL